MLDKDDICIDDYDHAGRQEVHYQAGRDPEGRDWKKSFRESKLTFTEDQVRAETARCLSCGASIVDPNRCVGCGICTTKCEFDAITIHRDRPECSEMHVAEDKMKYILPYAAKQAIHIKFGKKK